MTTDKTRRALPLLRFLRSRNRSLCLFCSFPALLSSCLLSAQTLVSSALYFFPLLAVAECMMLGRLGRLRTMLNSHSACVRDVVEEGNCHLSIWIGNNKKKLHRVSYVRENFILGGQRPPKPLAMSAQTGVCVRRWRSGSMVPSGEPLIRVRGKSSPCRLLLRQVCVGKQTVAW